MSTQRRRVLWSAGIGPAPLEDRVDAAAANGYDVVSISTLDHQRAVEAGVDPGEITRRARDRGIDTAIIDGMIEWHPHDPPKVPLGGSNLTVDQVFAMAADFDVKLVNAIAPFRTQLSTEGLAEHFAALCDRAAEFGMQVHFEFTPRSPVPDVGTAWKMVRLADRPNGGILFDTWHFYRTNPDFDELAEVPGDRILAVQVSDGRPEFVEGLLQDTFRHRYLPGEGSFDLVRVLRVLDEMGCLSVVGPEVLAEELFALPAMENARIAGEAYDRVMAAAFEPVS
jgi:sugar phosphate isomerase/epimerase